jgi:hypothetical protein
LPTNEVSDLVVDAIVFSVRDDVPPSSFGRAGLSSDVPDDAVEAVEAAVIVAVAVVVVAIPAPPPSPSSPPSSRTSFDGGCGGDDDRGRPDRAGIAIVPLASSPAIPPPSSRQFAP